VLSIFCVAVFRGVYDAEDDDDDELGRVESEAVPNEVRDWLAQTFTRSTTGAASKRLSGDGKPRFRSVANAIRAGILVDRQVYYSLTPDEVAVVYTANIIIIIISITPDYVCLP